MNAFQSLSSPTEKSEKIRKKNEQDNLITITEKIKLKKEQHKVLKIICDTYQTSFSEYIHEAVVEAMKFDIKEGNFCVTLLEKMNDDDKKNNNSPRQTAPNPMNVDLDMLKKLHTQL